MASISMHILSLDHALQTKISLARIFWLRVNDLILIILKSGAFPHPLSMPSLFETRLGSNKVRTRRELPSSAYIYLKEPICFPIPEIRVSQGEPRNDEHHYQHQHHRPIIIHHSKNRHHQCRPFLSLRLRPRLLLSSSLSVDPRIM